MERPYEFSVEEVYCSYSRTGTVFLSDEEVERLVHFLQEEDDETSIYTSDLEKRHPDIFHKIDDAAVPLMEEMDALEPDGMYGVWIPDEIVKMAFGEDYFDL